MSCWISIFIYLFREDWQRWSSNASSSGVSSCQYKQPTVCIDMKRMFSCVLMPFSPLHLFKECYVIAYQFAYSSSFSFIDLPGSVIQPFYLMLWNRPVLEGGAVWPGRQTHRCVCMPATAGRLKLSLMFVSYHRRSQRRCFSTTTFSSTWRATRQSTTCAVRSSRSTTPPKNSEGSWSKLEGWGFPLHCGWTKKAQNTSDFFSVVCRAVAVACPSLLSSVALSGIPTTQLVFRRSPKSEFGSWAFCKSFPTR